MGRKIIADGVYKPLAGFVTRLTENITYKTTYLPIDEVSYQILLNNLAQGDYSFLEIRDGNAIEVVKVINFCDKREYKINIFSWEIAFFQHVKCIII